MYFLQLSFSNARHAGSGELRISRTGGDNIAKWTINDEGPQGLELLQLIATACGGTTIVPRLHFDLGRLGRAAADYLQIELVLALFAPYEASPDKQGPTTLGIRWDRARGLAPLGKHDFERLTPEGPVRRPRAGMGSSAFFLLGYGGRPTCHSGTDDFDFGDPYFRLRRIQPLFESAARLTDPVEFLTRLHYRGIRCRRPATGGVLQRLASLLHEHLGIESFGWLERACDFKKEWGTLSLPEQRVAAVLLDVVRQLLDAHQTSIAPLDTPALILWDRPDRFSPPGMFQHWAKLMDGLLPRAQFVVTLDQQSRGLLPQALLASTCRIPAPEQQPHELRSRLPRRSILLLDLDSRLPNLALMKLSRHFKDHGKRVVLALQVFVQLELNDGPANGSSNTVRDLSRGAVLKSTPAHSADGTSNRPALPGICAIPTAARRACHGAGVKRQQRAARTLTQHAGTGIWSVLAFRPSVWAFGDCVDGRSSRCGS